MNKTDVIKRYLGESVRKYGFVFSNASGGFWVFEREVGNIRQEIIIQQHRFFADQIKMIFHTTANGWGDQDIRDYLPEYKTQEFWKYDSEVEFEGVILFFAKVVKENGIRVLDEMLVPKDPVYATPDMEKRLYENNDRFQEILHKEYDFGRTGEEAIIKLVELVYEKRNEEFDKVKEFLIQMASIYLEILSNDIEGEVIFEDNRCYFLTKRKKLVEWPLFSLIEQWKEFHTSAQPHENWLLYYYKLLRNGE